MMIRSGVDYGESDKRAVTWHDNGASTRIPGRGVDGQAPESTIFGPTPAARSLVAEPLIAL
jgi:hypothetical protein